jgi:hypothetical protein
MIDAQTAGLLQGIIRREGRSLLQYVGDAFPWTRSAEQDSLSQLQALIHEERDATAELARFLSRNRVSPPYLGAYPMGFTTLNFVAFDSLLPRLIEQQRRGLGVLEGEVPQIHDQESREALHHLVEVKQRHLKALEGMSARARETTTA